MITKIKPELGRKYDLFCEVDKPEDSFEGFYMGIRPVKTFIFSKLSRPEGHIFVRKTNERTLELYCTRTSEQTIAIKWASDGDDGPEWPLGFAVEKVDVRLSQQEREYLEDRINEWGNLERVA
jgi:hypothetical protein